MIKELLVNSGVHGHFAVKLSFNQAVIKNIILKFELNFILFAHFLLTKKSNQLAEIVGTSFVCVFFETDK